MAPVIISALAQDAVAQRSSPAVVIESFAPERRVRSPGDTAVATVVARNVTDSERRVWVGYSVQDPDNDWHDIEPVRLDLAPGARATVRMQWVIPLDAGLPAGMYRIVMAVWSAPPGAANAIRLANADQRNSFRMRIADARLFGAEPQWRAGDHRLGHGRFRPENVKADRSGFRLLLPARSCDGGELRGMTYQRFGAYTARMKTPKAPGSLSAFFFYGNARGEADEIDIEIYNDESRGAILTAWVDGKKTRGTDVTLPFDPSSGFHDYTMRWTAGELVFLADDTELARWTTGYPKQPMRLMANVWWPAWLTCLPLSETRSLDIRRIGPLGSMR